MKTIRPLTVDVASELIDFGGGALSASLAAEQLDGAVAIHNILAKEGCAYLADEVGMGKTYVALGVVALLRFFHPELRVLYIAPRENIQAKWVKELRNFTRNNWLRSDQRVRSFNGTPAVRVAFCRNLADWAGQAVRNPDRDFFLRLSSFSFPLPHDGQKWHAKRAELEAVAPVVDRSWFNLHNKERFKGSYARAVNALLPHYDLVVIDEAHNLKHGLESKASRNQLLAQLLGREPREENDDWPHYGRRFDRVLLLSATPLETDYKEVWNQLDLFGFGRRAAALADPELDEAAKADALGRFMIRRITRLSIGGEPHTKNMYRREWRRGGCVIHDEPLEAPDERQKLIVALVQKKVAETLNDPRFNASFQIGMLASFESFLQTAKVSTSDGDAISVFDQTEQTDDESEREGIDTNAVNRLADSYKREFGQSLPHPKMDAVVESLKEAFERGEKTLVFVRRVRSVTELREKLCRKYDEWLKERLRKNLHSGPRAELEKVWELYEAERREKRPEETPAASGRVEDPGDGDGWLSNQPEDDQGGTDTFFSWFFRGMGPGNVLSGAAFKKNRLQGEGSAYSIFFEDNYVASLLDATAAVQVRLAEELGRPGAELTDELRRAAYAVFRATTRQTKFPRLRVFHAYQNAVLALVANSGSPHARDARTIALELYGGRDPQMAAAVPDSFPAPEEYLNARTFFTELRLRPQLAEDIWPRPSGEHFHERFREREARRELLAAMMRLGHAFIDLWMLFVNRVRTLSLHAQERDAEQRAEALAEDYLNLLEEQRRDVELDPHLFNTYRELSDAGRQHELIFAVNFPEAARDSLPSLARLFGHTLSAQTPVGGMFGGVNATLVKQFRMPGYPLALVTTDVLQEGEDLHTFCSRIVHYGISWTPSAMEQRTGRVDRIGSLTHRRLDNLDRRAHPQEMLQVYYPYLADTVEALQVERVFDRMNRFVRMIHHTTGAEESDSRLDTRVEFVRARRHSRQITSMLESAFPVKPEHLTGETTMLPSRVFQSVERALAQLQAAAEELGQRARILWDETHDAAALYGTVYVENRRLLRPDNRRAAGEGSVRQQPFALILRGSGAVGSLLLHAVSPIGEVTGWSAQELMECAAGVRGAKLCEVPGENFESYNLTVEGDIVFHPERAQTDDILDLVERVTIAADIIEQAIMEGEDAPLVRFRKDLQQEADPHAED
ncbi:MAG TPA: helicase-related protein [Pyrinomonadaceae bacterium]